MSQSHYENAKAKSSASSFLVETHQQEVYTKIGESNFKARQFHNENNQEETSIVNPETSVASTVFDSSGNFVEFVFSNSGKFHKLRSIDLQFTIVNNHANSVGLGPVDFMVSRTEYFLGDRLISTMHGISNFIVQQGMSTYDERNVLKSMTNVDPTAYDENAVLTTGSSKRYSTNITGPLKSMGLFLPGLIQKLRIVIYFEAASVFSTSGTVDIAVSDVKCYVDHTKLNKSNYDKEMLMYKEAGVRLRYISHNYAKHSSAQTASTESNQKLSNVSGLSSMLYVFSRDANPSGTGLVTFKAMDSLHLTNGSENITGGSDLSGELLQYRAHRYLVSDLCSVHNIYPFFFCSDAVNVINNCANTGYLAINSEHHVAHFTPSATDATSQIEFLSINYNNLYIRNGTIVIERTQ